MEGKTAHIHGRFQPFHREHADYARWASKDNDNLIVGITNADPSHITPEEANPKRHKPEHNPFTYFERQQMIQNFLRESEINCETFVMPFPINKPELWEYYASQSVIHYVNILEEWQVVKANRIEEHGRNVITKWDERNVSGEEIRKRMANGQEWESEVPDSVIEIINEIDGTNRVIELLK